MVEELLSDVRYRSRRFIIAAFIEAFASLVCALLIIVNLPKIAVIMPLLWWWASISSSVLALYGASKIFDKEGRTS